MVFRTDSLCQLAEHCKAVWLTVAALLVRDQGKSWERNTLNDMKVQVGDCFSNSQKVLCTKALWTESENTTNKNHHGHLFLKRNNILKLAKHFLWGPFLGSSCSRIPWIITKKPSLAYLFDGSRRMQPVRRRTKRNKSNPDLVKEKAPGNL